MTYISSSPIATGASASCIIKRALTRLSILRVGGTPDAAQLENGLAALNEMIDGWAADGIYITPLVPLNAKHTPGLIALLAMELASDYGIASIIPPTLARRAQDGKAALFADFVVIPQANFDAALRNLPSQRLLGQRGVPFDIVSVLPDGSPSYSGFATLALNSSTTTVTDANCTASAQVVLTPYNEAAQAEWELVRPTVSPGAGSFVITHKNEPIIDRVFEYLITP